MSYHALGGGVAVTDVQLLLSIGIPSLLIVLSWINNNVRFNGIDRRIDAVEQRLDQHEKRFDDLQSAGHKDALEIIRAMTALHERVAVVGTKQNLQ